MRLRVKEIHERERRTIDFIEMTLQHNSNVILMIQTIILYLDFANFNFSIEKLLDRRMLIKQPFRCNIDENKLK